MYRNNSHGAPANKQKKTLSALLISLIHYIIVLYIHIFMPSRERQIALIRKLAEDCYCTSFNYRETDKSIC
ncbi:hypothetical protein CISIN_1g036115mg [Citrus sinensis]|uniref:Uncharacterized protein n=1 Tax=Citrus sinensis TaxID=2711 RepID=A0A067DQY4_CITSI|nr:hypothetical protein CISIN_1g036115mg [Citrus sinensis]